MDDIRRDAASLQVRVAKLPLFVLACLQSNGLYPTTLREEAPFLHGILLSLLVNKGAPLSPTLEYVSVENEYSTAREALVQRRTDFYRGMLPWHILQDFCATTSLEQSLAPIRDVVAAHTAHTCLDWCVGEGGCGKNIWDSVLQSRENMVDDNKWDVVSSRILSGVSSILSQLVDLWNDSLGACSQGLKVDGPDDVASAVAASRALLKLAEQRCERALVVRLMCDAAACQANHEILRMTAAAANLMTTAQLESDVAEVNALVGRARATVAKVQVLRAQVVRDTYCVDGAVPALINARTMVETRKAEIEQQVAQKRAQLRRYRELGPSFEAMAIEHRRLLSDREQKIWSRNQLCADFS